VVIEQNQRFGFFITTTNNFTLFLFLSLKAINNKQTIIIIIEKRKKGFSELDLGFPSIPKLDN
jgi:hypothetical protein